MKMLHCAHLTVSINVAITVLTLIQIAADKSYISRHLLHIRKMETFILQSTPLDRLSGRGGGGKRRGSGRGRSRDNIKPWSQSAPVFPGGHRHIPFCGWHWPDPHEHSWTQLLPKKPWGHAIFAKSAKSQFYFYNNIFLENKYFQWLLNKIMSKIVV